MARRTTPAGRAAIAVVALAGAFAWPDSVAAQARGPSLELRLDALEGGRGTPATAHAGAGIAVRLGTYARAALLAGAGPSRDGGSGRVEGLLRFHLDPMRERRWGVYGAAGVGAIWSSSGEPYLALLIGVEGERRGRLAPALEAGLGRGARLAVVLRRGSQAGR